MTVLQSCSGCESYLLQVTGGKNTRFSGIYIDPSAQTAKLIHWNSFRRELFWDLDGSIANLMGGLITYENGSYITPYKNHLDGLDGCVYNLTDIWDGSIICNRANVHLRTLIINNPTS